MDNNKKTSTYEKIKECEQSRYSVSKFCFCQLQRDNIRFNKKFSYDLSNSNAFICRILCNYIPYANSHFKEQINQEIVEAMKQKKRKGLCEPPRLALTDELRKRLTYFDFVKAKKNNGNNGLKFNMNKMLSYLLERYSHHTLAEREQIYFYGEYNTIISNLYDKEDPKILAVEHSNGKKYEVKPYKCEIDDNSFSYYLLGYSRELGSDAEFKHTTFSLSRIVSCRDTGKKFSLSQKETAEIEELYTSFGAAYIMPGFNKEEHKIEKSVVMLTKKGYEELFLDKISYQRPLPCCEPEIIEKNEKEIYYKLTFECSYFQINNYFFTFGDDALIIEPECINKKFSERFEKALENTKENVQTILKKTIKSDNIII